MEFNRVEFRVFSSRRPVTIPRLKSQSNLLFSQSWIPTFPNGSQQLIQEFFFGSTYDFFLVLGGMNLGRHRMFPYMKT